MIEISRLNKRIKGELIVNDVSLAIKPQQIYAVLGDDAFGMSVFLKCIAGIYRPNIGSVQIDGEEVYDNETLKQQIFLISKDLFLPRLMPVAEVGTFYAGYSLFWEADVYDRLLKVNAIDPKQRIFQLSESQRDVIRLIIGLSSGAKYLLLDQPMANLPTQIRRQMMMILRSYVRDKEANVVLTADKLDRLGQDIRHFGYMEEGILWDGQTFAGDPDEDSKILRKEETEYDLEHFFQK